MLKPVAKWGVAAVALAWAGAASATPMGGIINFNSSAPLPDPGALTAAVDLGPFGANSNTSTGASSGEFLDVTNMNTKSFALSLGMFDIPSGTTSGLVAEPPPQLSISGTGLGTFQATQVEVIARGLANTPLPTSTLSLYFLGTFTPDFGGLSTQDASARLDLVRGMDPVTGQYTLSFTGEITALGSSPPPSVPEPASMAVLGAGLLGLGLARRRKAH